MRCSWAFRNRPARLACRALCQVKTNYIRHADARDQKTYFSKSRNSLSRLFGSSRVVETIKPEELELGPAQFLRKEHFHESKFLVDHAGVCERGNSRLVTGAGVSLRKGRVPFPKPQPKVAPNKRRRPGKRRPSGKRPPRNFGLRKSHEPEGRRQGALVAQNTEDESARKPRGRRSKATANNLADAKQRLEMHENVANAVAKLPAADKQRMENCCKMSAVRTKLQNASTQRLNGFLGQSQCRERLPGNPARRSETEPGLDESGGHLSQHREAGNFNWTPTAGRLMPAPEWEVSPPMCVITW